MALLFPLLYVSGERVLINQGNMSNLLVDWLNSLGLSRDIHSFGNTFKDGYLLGEILFKYNQQLDFDQFSEKPTPIVVLNNFKLLEPTFRRIGVNFNARVAGDIMKGDEKTTKTLLYELKMSLDRISRNSRQSTNPMLWGTRNDKVLSVVGNTRPAYDSSVLNTFQIGVRGVLENTNQVMMNHVTQKFVDREHDYMRNISVAESVDYEITTLNRLRAKDIYKSRKEHEGEFAEAWEALNLDQWRKNQKTAHDRKVMVATIEKNIQTQKDKKIEKLRTQTRDYSYKSMDNFDNKLETMILPDEKNDPKYASQKSFIRTINA